MLWLRLWLELHTAEAGMDAKYFRILLKHFRSTQVPIKERI
jgi:hypothetical protein